MVGGSSGGVIRACEGQMRDRSSGVLDGRHPYVRWLVKRGCGRGWWWWVAVAVVLSELVREFGGSKCETALVGSVMVATHLFVG